MKTMLMTLGILILLVGSLLVISYGWTYFTAYSENGYCKNADEHAEKAKKLLQENKIKEAVNETSFMEHSQKGCNEFIAEAKSKLTMWSGITLLGLLMTIGGSLSGKKKVVP